MAKTQKTNKNFRKPRKDNRKQLLAASQAVEVIERRYQVVELKRDGYTHKQIADKLGLSLETVSNDLVEVLTQTVEDYKLTTELERQLSNERIEQLIKTFTPYATEPHKIVVVDRVTKLQSVIEVPPNPEFARLIISLEERRSKLNGLDKPLKLEVEATAIREYKGVNTDLV